MRKINKPLESKKPKRKKIVNKNTIKDEVEGKKLITSKIPPKAIKKVSIKKVAKKKHVFETADLDGTKAPIIERYGFYKTARFKEDKYIKVRSDISDAGYDKVYNLVQLKQIEWAFMFTDVNGVKWQYFLILGNK